ncbi:RmlC-like cupin [Atractiella rhizophila]|nr:RmlC-like cupin [Atractiella rhizophila]
MYPSKLSIAFKLLSLVATARATVEPQTFVNIQNSPGQLGKFNVLSDDPQNFIFDFFNPSSQVGISTGLDGRTVAADVRNFPALIGNGVAITLGFLGPCGMNTPHVHPRATEFNLAINGTLRSGFVQENGAKFIMHDTQPGQAIIFPRGAIHFEQNEGCEYRYKECALTEGWTQPMFFVAAFSSEDPGTDQIANTLFQNLPSDVVSAVLGGIGVEAVEGIASITPSNVAFGTEECLKRCGLTRPGPSDQWNDLTNSLVASTASSSGSNNRIAGIGSSDSTGSSSLKIAPVGAASENSGNGSSGTNKVLLALLIVVLIFNLAILGGAAYLFYHYRSKAPGSQKDSTRSLYSVPVIQTPTGANQRWTTAPAHSHRRSLTPESTPLRDEKYDGPERFDRSPSPSRSSFHATLGDKE